MSYLRLRQEAAVSCFINLSTSVYLANLQMLCMNITIFADVEMLRFLDLHNNTIYQYRLIEDCRNHHQRLLNILIP